MIDYSIAAIPTKYNGRQYRSRLEARWAAFFDLLGWRCEYEPMDLGSWSPDFLLQGCDNPILCEVKPIAEIDEDVCRKMAVAASEARFKGELLLLGLSPFVLTEGWLGWLDDCCDWDGPDGQRPPCFGTFGPCIFVKPPNVVADFGHYYNSYHGRITGIYDGDYYTGDISRHGISEIWSAATNSAQWSRKA